MLQAARGKPTRGAGLQPAFSIRTAGCNLPHEEHKAAAFRLTDRDRHPPAASQALV
jgi:hypothetical protein